MKQILALLFIISVFSLNAAPPLAESLKVKDPSKKYLKRILKAKNLVVDHVTKDGYEVYGPKGTLEFLESKGIQAYQEFFLLQKPSYPSYLEIVSKLKNLAKTYPDITKLYSVGKTVQGRDLWVMKISDNVEKDETEPEFKYISSMHGDEIVGRELLILFMKDLLKSYKAGNKTSKTLIDNTEIFIMASMNPDGSELPRRWNANGKDLNRDFPDFTTRDDQNTVEGRQPETQAIMKWQRRRNFALSANFHGGAVVMNYPWDTEKAHHPLKNFIIKVAKHYAKTNIPMRDSREFPGGIVNGYDWYEVDGGMQDWSYYWHNDLQFTVELSNTKYPDYSTIGPFYRDNKQSLVNLVKLVHSGAGVYFKDKKIKGKVEVIQNKPTKRNLGSFDFKSGEFYKVLPNGEYTYKITVGGKTTEKKVTVDFPKFDKNGKFLRLRAPAL